MGNIPLRVITRAQAREVQDKNKIHKHEKERDENENKKPQKRWLRRRRAKSKKSSEEKQPSEDNITKSNKPVPTTLANEQKESPDKNFEVSEGGFVLVERVNEQLDAIRMAYKSCYACSSGNP